MFEDHYKTGACCKTSLWLKYHVSIAMELRQWERCNSCCFYFGSGSCQFRDKNRGVLDLPLLNFLIKFEVIQSTYTMHLTHFIYS